MSRVVPGLRGTFGSGTLVVMSSRTSQDVLSCPKTSWDFCSGIVRKVRGSPGHVSLSPGNSCLSTKTLMEIKKKKCVLLKEKESDWLQVWMTTSLLDVKGKAITKSFVFLAIWSVFPQSHIRCHK